MKIFVNISESNFGKVLIARTEKGLCAIVFGKHNEELCEEVCKIVGITNQTITNDNFVFEDGNYYKDIVQKINNNSIYLKDIPIDLCNGTKFQRQVWEVISQIPRGQTKTYKEIATTIGSPNAVRAVGTACGKNPLSVIIPCHRVVPSSKVGIGNYRWGIKMKEELLKREL